MPGPTHATPIEPLEIRRLFATLVVNGSNNADTITLDVDANFINADVNGFNVPQPVGLWDAIQINGLGGDDIILINSTGDEPVDVFPGTGKDFIAAVNSGDMDDLSAEVRVHSGTDSIDDRTSVFDNEDAGN